MAHEAILNTPVSGQQIRLVQIIDQPVKGDKHDTVHCFMFRADLDGGNPPLQTFQAVNCHVWEDEPTGKPRDQSTIVINGKPMSVGSSVDNFLRQQRYCWRSITHPALKMDLCPIPIWIDAVCIDQDNDHERTQHAAIKDSIYRRACSVVSYLEIDPHSQYFLCHSSWCDILDNVVLALSADPSTVLEVDGDVAQGAAIVWRDLGRRVWWARRMEQFEDLQIHNGPDVYLLGRHSLRWPADFTMLVELARLFAPNAMPYLMYNVAQVSGRFFREVAWLRKERLWSPKDVDQPKLNNLAFASQKIDFGTPAFSREFDEAMRRSWGSKLSSEWQYQMLELLNYRRDADPMAPLPSWVPDLSQ